MTSRASGLGAAVLATLTLLIGFVAGTFFGTSDSDSPAFLGPSDPDPRPTGDPSEAAARSAPLEREPARASPVTPAAYRVSDAELARARSAIDVAPETAPEGTARITGQAATLLGEPLEGVVVEAELRIESDPYGEFSDGLGQGNPIDSSLDDALAERAESWARTRGRRYRAVTGLDGSYAFHQLPAGRYRLSAYKAGYVFESAGGGRGYVEAGGTQDFAAHPVVEFTANIRMPDGSEPAIATIHVKRDRSTTSIRWTPERRVIRLSATEGTAEALTGFVTGPGYGSRAPARYRSAVVRLSDAQRELDFQLAPQVGIYGRIVDRYGVPMRQVALLDLSRDPTVSADAFKASATRTGISSDVFEFLGLTPGPYAIGLLDRSDALLASATVTVPDGLVEQHLEPAKPSPDDSIRVLCLSPKGVPVFDVEFGYAVFGEGGSSSGSVRGAVRDSDGAYWIPVASLRRFESERGSAVVRITARHPRFGQCHGDLGTGARELTLRFAEPCRLTVTVPGHAQSPFRGSLRVQMLAEPEKLERGGISRTVNGESVTAEILADGTAEFSNLRPGSWTAQLVLEGNRMWGGTTTIATARVELAAPAQQVSLPIPPLYDIVVQAPTLEPRTHVWIQRVRSEGESASPQFDSFYASAQFDEQRRVTFTRMPAGRYRVHASGSVEPLDIDVPGGPYVLAARVIDCARVSISDQDGVLHRAGLRPGDLVTSINGVRFTADNWWQVLNEQGRKKGVPLTLIRDGREMTLAGGDHAWNGEDVGGSYAPANREGDS